MGLPPPTFTTIPGVDETKIIRVRGERRREWTIPHKIGMLYKVEIDSDRGDRRELAMAIRYGGIPHFGVVMNVHGETKGRLCGCWRSEDEWWIRLRGVISAELIGTWSSVFPHLTPPPHEYD